ESYQGTGDGINDVDTKLTTALAGLYELEREIGRGGMATVYLARDVRHHRMVAIKTLHPELAAVLGAERFLAEIRTTANLQHPHILPLFDSGTAGGQLYYVMPYVEGETLRSRLSRETQLPIGDALRVAREVAEALQYAHDHGVIHRDIKPENILLQGGHALVADFGIALAVQQAGGQRMTGTGLSLGTPQYMAPEQAMGEKIIDVRADVYALGAVTYEMLVGEPPFSGPNSQSIVARVLTAAPVPPSATRPTIPPHVERAVLTALAKLPADRHATAGAFAGELTGAIPSSASDVVTTVSSYRNASVGRPAATRLLAATAAVALVAIVAAVMGWRRSEPPRHVARFSVALPDGDGLGPPNQFRIALSPDGRQLVYVGSGANNGTQLWRRAMNELRGEPISGTEGAMSPSFSPDGKRLAFVSGNPRVLRSIDLEGGVVVTLTDSLVDAGGVSWGSDGYVYYDGHLAGDGLARVRETGGVPEVASKPDSANGSTSHNNPSALPNARGVLFTVANVGGPELHQIAVLDTRTGKHRVLGRGVAARYAATGHLVYVTADGNMLAAPFDAHRLTMSGDAIPLATGVSVRLGNRVDLAISPAGRMVYAAGASTSSLRELVWVTRGGVASTVDSTFSIGARRESMNEQRSERSAVSLAPDGRSVAVVTTGVRTGSLWIKRLEPVPPSRIGDVNGTSVAWSPDGKVLVVGTSTGLSFMAADGRVLPRANLSLGREATFVRYSPDGAFILFTSGGDLFAVRSNGDTTLLPLVVSPYGERNGRISPDGTWLAYVSEETGAPETYVRPFPDTKASRHQVSSNRGTGPTWAPDGTELFFIDSARDMNVVSVGAGPTFITSAPRKLFSTTPYGAGLIDIAPDGKRFLFTRFKSQQAPQGADLIVVENFLDDLSGRMRVRR
ncbi:MAG: protein kinase, partial [Gemmatimonas sp.]